MRKAWSRRTQSELTPKLPSNTIQLTMKILTASSDIVRVQLVTSMRMRYEGNWDLLGIALLETADSEESSEEASHLEVEMQLAGSTAQQK